MRKAVQALAFFFVVLPTTACVIGEHRMPTGEQYILEAIASALLGPGVPRARLEKATALVQARLVEIGSGPLSRRTQVPVRAALSVLARSNLVGCSEALRDVYDAIHRVSQTEATILVRGESGSGKELVAQAIHHAGSRAHGPFITLHCAALTETLLESELFGHERGAFTGATDTRKGRFELAHGGTLFLDEVGDIQPSTQVKLLRVLQDRTFERVGGSRPLSVDVRIIAATHRNLEGMAESGAFRQDLYYRLNVVPIMLPPLRERDGDIPLLINHFLGLLNTQYNRRINLGADLRQLMVSYHWPGNIRELQNCMERLVVLSDPEQSQVSLHSIPPSLSGYFHDMTRVVGREPASSKDEREGHDLLQEKLERIERSNLLDALNRNGWVQARAARELGLSPRQVAYKILKFRVAPPKKSR